MVAQGSSKREASLSTIKDLLSSRLCCYAFFTVAILCCHLFMVQGFGDDGSWPPIIDSFSTPGDYFQFLSIRWSEWSSRIIIEAVMIVAEGLPWGVWICVDVLIWILLLHSLESLFAIRNTRRAYLWVLVALMLQCPLLDLGCAGWIATLVNYLWPLAFGLFSASIIKKLLNGENVCIVSVILVIPSLVFAANQEQACVILILSAGLTAIWMFRSKRIHPYVIVCSLIVLIELVAELLCPGNSARSAAEIPNWMPAFPELNVAEKIDMGLVHLSNWLFSSINPTVLAFLAFMFMLSLKNKQNGIPASILSVLLTCLYLGQTVLVEAYPAADIIFRPLEEFFNPSGSALANGMRTLVSVVFFALIPVAIKLAFVDASSRNLGLIVYGMGLLTALMMGFSPTVYASEGRTLVFFYFALCALAFMAAMQLMRGRKGEAISISLMAILFSVLAVLNTSYLVANFG